VPSQVQLTMYIKLLVAEDYRTQVQNYEPVNGEGNLQTTPRSAMSNAL
jgi:hypothetical protein